MDRTETQDSESARISGGSGSKGSAPETMAAQRVDEIRGAGGVPAASAAPVDEMAEAHARDYRDQARMRELRDEIDGFLASPPSRCRPGTLRALTHALGALGDDQARVSRAWD